MRLRYLGGAIAPNNQPLSNANTAVGEARQYQGSFSRQDVGQAETRGLWIADPHAVDQATVMNVNADNAPNALQNNTFIDGAQNLPVTRTGTVTQGSFSPYTNPAGTWSAYFGGTGNYIVTNTAAFTTTQSTFTIECWMCTTAANTTNPALVGDMAVGGSNFWSFGPNVNNKLDFYWADGAAQHAVGTTILKRNTWYHIAVSVNANVISLFVNGVPEVMTGTTTLTTRSGTTSTITLGQSQATVQTYTGYVSNLSILSGTAKYAAGVTFNPPNNPLPANTTNQVFLFGQDNIMVDENTATTAKTLTFTGAVAVSTFSPFYTPYTYKNNTFGASMSFNGTNQYLSLAGDAAWDFGSGAFTVEGFFNTTATTTRAIVGQVSSSGAAATSSFCLYAAVSGFPAFSFSLSGAGAFTTITATVPTPTNIWVHLAAVRNGTTVTLYMNGVSVGSASAGTTAMNTTTASLGIGRSGDVPTGEYFGGTLSNVRIVKGTAVYTANFTTPTQPLQAIANTQLLTCQGSDVDLSTNNFTIANNNAVTASTSGPFTTYVNQTFRSWPAGSLSYDGTASYLTLNGSSTLAFGSNDFTISMWVYLNALPNPNGVLYDSRPSADGAYPTLYVAVTTNVLTYYVSTAARITGTTALKVGQWYYITVTRVSGTTRMYLNGTQEGSDYVDATVYLNGAARPVIGNNGLNLLGPITGFIYGVQVRNGTGTGSGVPSYPNFSPNTLPNTRLYLSGVNAGIYDTVGFTDYLTVGNAQVTATNIKYGSGAMYFDGTGDWLTSRATTANANAANLQLGQDDFTIEAWINVSTFAAVRSIVSKGTATTGWTVEISTTGRLSFAQTAVAAVSGNTFIPAGVWTHIAVVRSGSGANNITMYVNGILDYVSATAVTTNFNQTDLIYIGADRAGGTPFLGYISDLRITKAARYLTNFVPPRATLPKH